MKSTTLIAFLLFTLMILCAGCAPGKAAAIKTPEHNQIAPTGARSENSQPPISATQIPTVTLGSLYKGTPLSQGFEPVTRNDDWALVVKELGGVEMALVPIGCFEMGSTDEQVDDAMQWCEQLRGAGNCDRSWYQNEQPSVTICFDEPFWIDVYEVTNAQYGSSGEWSGDKYPREDIDWADAANHCESRGARLPTESEWEFAARGPDGLVFPWGDVFKRANVNSCDQSCEYNMIGTRLSDGYANTAPVGSYPGGASWVGVMDLSGNIWEWTSSIYMDYPYNAKDGREVDGSTDSNSKRVIRGGSWYHSGSDLLRSTARYAVRPDFRDNVTGFRCAASYNYMPISSGLTTSRQDSVQPRSSFELFSESVNDLYKIYIGLPDGYDPERSRGYHVIFLLDGDWYFDDSSMMIGDGGVAGIVGMLSDGGRIPRSIVVGIGYPVKNQRGRDFHWRLENFYTFLVEELIPHIDQEYNTNPDAPRTLIGHSSGGYFTMYSFLQYGKTGINPFENFIAISGDYSKLDFFLFDEESRMSRLIGDGGKLEAALYMTVGGKDEARFVNSMQGMTRKLENRDYQYFHFRSRVYGSDNHMSVVTPAVWAGLLWVFGGE